MGIRIKAGLAVAMAFLCGPALAQVALLPGAQQTGAPVPTTFTSKIGYFDADPVPGASYPRVIQLKYFARGKGQLLATFGRRGALPIYRSTDNGETWQHFSEIPGLTGQPCLYELPVKMGEFPAGTVMAAGTGIVGVDPNKRTLDVFVSTDGGKDWAFLSTLATGGPGRYDPADRAGLLDQNPIFEPYLYADAAGRLVGFFSDERYKKDGYSQLLDHKVSNDGGRTWGELVYDVAIADGLSRPGMTIVTRDGRGKFYMSYEVVGMPGHALEPRSNLAHFRTSDDGDSWGNYKDYGTLIQDRWRQYPNGTPYLVWSPWGGPNGTLVASGRSIMRYDLGLTGNGMMINRNNGQGLWTLIETPIVYNPALDGYSQTMIPLGDGQEILQLVSVGNRIAYAKFKLPEKLPEYPFPWGGPKTTDARKAED
ncbi:MAG TPA: sialidase family protein [Rhizomicrobium sp.]|nr:sialidase family protein [Rhizomicrobium sp.]